MSAADRAAKARARMEQVRREMSERRALRARNGQATREKAHDNLMKQGPVAAQVAKHMGELGRRRKAAGGWATEKTERDKDYILGFSGDDDEHREGFAYRATPRPQGDTRPGGLGAIEDDEEAEVAEPTPPAPEAPAARQPRRAAPMRSMESVDDEDDFSNQSSWMRNQ